MKKNIFFLALAFSFTYTVASEVQQFFYGIKVATIVTVITLGIQPTCGDVSFNNKVQGLLSYNPQPLSLSPTVLGNNQISKNSFSCFSNVCNPGSKGYILLEEAVEPQYPSSMKKEIASNNLPAALPEQKLSQFCPADRKGSYNPGEKGYLLK